jgi:hypothetical protein
LHFHPLFCPNFSCHFFRVDTFRRVFKHFLLFITVALVFSCN